MQYLIFDVADNKYALNIDVISEIIKNNVNITPMPLTKPTQLGIIPLRKEVINIYSAGRLLNRKNTENSNIVIIEKDGRKLGITIDSVYAIKDDALLTESDIEMQKIEDETYIKKAFKDKDSNEIYLELNEEELIKA